MTISLQVNGTFSLEAAAEFAAGFPGTEVIREGTELRFAWAVDGDWRIAEVSLHETPETVRGELRVPQAAAAQAREDVERILCLDVDGAGFAAVGRRDPVVRALQRRYAGLRPVLFYTPYEAATWTIIGHRIQMVQAAHIRRRLAEEHGQRGAFPAPSAVKRLSAPQRGLAGQKVDQLHHLAAAAAAGRLGRDHLRSLGADEAIERLQELPGIGPFSAELIWVRGVGDPDRMPQHERRLEKAMRAVYGLGDADPLEPVSEHWRPYRAWVALLLRQWLADGAEDLTTPQEGST